MATFADLQSDIIMAIASLLRLVDDKVSCWKNTLWILSICHSWRAAALPVIYGTVFIDIPKDFLGSGSPVTRNLLSYYKAPYTNSGLIYDNGYGFLVKRMFIRIRSKSQVPFPWLRVAEALNIDEDKYPDILAVRKLTESNTNAEYQIASKNIACIKAFGPVAHTLALRFPNVSSLGIKTNDCHNSRTQIYVLSKLISAYASQLAKIDLNGFAINPKLLKTANICYFGNRSYYGFQDGPFINPKPLVCLKLHSSSNKNHWNQFRCDNDTRSIEFTNLERLQLTCSDPIRTVLSKEVWHIKFPKLIHLKAHRDMISNLDIQHTPFNLKTLDYTGTGDDTIKLLENNTGALEKVHLKLTVYQCDLDGNDQFSSQTNTIFSMVGPIKEFSCTGLKAHDLRMSSIYWPNLTRLELRTSIEPYKFLRSIDRIPHLQHLHLSIISSMDGYRDVADSDEDPEYADYTRRDRSKMFDWPSIEQSQLLDLKSERSQSRLETLSIYWYTNDSYDWYLRSIDLRTNVDEDPAFVDYLYSDVDSDAGLSSDDGGYYHMPMDDKETVSALRAYLPNLVATTLIFTTGSFSTEDNYMEDSNSDDSDDSDGSNY